MKLLTAMLLVTLVFSSIFFNNTTAAAAGTTTALEEGYCDKQCGARCAVAGVKDRCLKYCGICCNECKCVPSGTYGNKHQCPCYRDKTNSKGKPKCP